MEVSASGAWWAFALKVSVVLYFVFALVGGVLFPVALVRVGGGSWFSVVGWFVVHCWVAGLAVVGFGRVAEEVGWEVEFWGDDDSEGGGEVG